MTSLTANSPEKWKYWQSYSRLISGLAASSAKVQHYVKTLYNIAERYQEPLGNSYLITYASIDSWLTSIDIPSSEILTLRQALLSAIPRNSETARFGIMPSEFVLCFLLIMLLESEEVKQVQSYIDALRQLTFIFYETEGRGYLPKDQWKEICAHSANPVDRIIKVAAEGFASLAMCTNACSLTDKQSRRREDMEQFLLDCDNHITYGRYYEACQRGYVQESTYLFNFPVIAEALRYQLGPANQLPTQSGGHKEELSQETEQSGVREIAVVDRAPYNDGEESPYRSNSARSAEVATALDAAVDREFSQDPIPVEFSCPLDVLHNQQSRKQSIPEPSGQCGEQTDDLRSDKGSENTQLKSEESICPSTERHPPSTERHSKSADPRSESSAKTIMVSPKAAETMPSSEPVFTTPRLGRSADAVESSASDNPLTHCDVPLKPCEPRDCISTAVGTTPGEETEVKEKIINHLINSVTPPTSVEIAHLFSKYVLDVLRDRSTLTPTFSMLNDLQRLCMISVLLLQSERPFDKISVDEGGKVYVIGHLRGRERRLRNTLLSQFPQLKMENNKVGADLNRSHIIFAGNYLDTAASLDYAESLRILMMLLTLKVVFRPRIKLLRGIIENIGYDALKKDIAAVPGVTESQACALWNMIMDVLQNLPVGCLISDWGVVYGGHLTEDVVACLPHVRELPPLLPPLEKSSISSGNNTLSLKRSKPTQDEMVSVIACSYNQMLTSVAPALVRLRTIHTKITYVVANGCYLNPRQPSPRGSDFTILCSVGRHKVCVDSVPIPPEGKPPASESRPRGSNENSMPRPKSVEEEAIDTFCNSIGR